MSKSKRSGGPRTEEGKQAASRNALKAGAYSKSILLPNESTSEFESFRARLWRDLGPQDGVEQGYVQQIAELLWKQQRLGHVRRDLRHLQASKPASTDDVRRVTTLGDAEARDIAWKLRQLPPLDPHLVDRAESILVALQTIERAKVETFSDSVLGVISKDLPALADALWDVAAQEFGTVDRSQPLTALCSAEEEGDPAQSFFPTAIETIESEVAEILGQRDAYGEHWPIARAVYTLRWMEDLVHGKSRPENDLATALEKALLQLRRHREWKRSMAAISTTVMPEQKSA